MELIDNTDISCFNSFQCFVQSPTGVANIILCPLSVIFNALYIYVRVSIKKDVESNIPTVALSCVNIFLSIETSFIYMYAGSFPIQELSFAYVVAAYMSAFCWQLLLLFAVSIDRYIAVIKPLHYHQIITKKRVIIATVGSGVIGLMMAAVAFTLPSRTLGEVIEFAIRTNSTVTLRLCYSDELLLFCKVLSAPFVAIGLAMFGFYFMIITAIRKQLKNSNATLRDYKGTLILLVSMLYFLLTFIPIFLALTSPLVLDTPFNDPMVTAFSTFVTICVISIGFVNSLLYGVGRKSFWIALCSDCKTNNTVTVLASA